MFCLCSLSGSVYDIESQLGEQYSTTSIQAIFRKAVKATNSTPWSTPHTLSRILRLTSVFLDTCRLAEILYKKRLVQNQTFLTSLTSSIASLTLVTPSLLETFRRCIPFVLKKLCLNYYLLITYFPNAKNFLFRFY